MQRLHLGVRHPFHKIVAAAILIAAASGVFALRGAAQAIIQPNVPLVADVASCPTTAVTIARTPFHVREQTTIAAGSSVTPVPGFLNSVPAGATFHVTNINAAFFGPVPDNYQVRLYRNNEIAAAFNLGDSMLTSGSVKEKTLNETTDMYFPADGSVYDLQLIRQSSGGIGNVVVTFWGYLTTNVCPPVRGQ
jgi:hypothetical protein